MQRSSRFAVGRAQPRHLRAVLALSALMLLAGCSSTLKSIQTWDGGSLEASQVAELQAPGQIQVTAVNGREVKTYLMDDLALNYSLLPGANTVVFRYKTIWAKGRAVENDEARVDVVESEPHQVTFEAAAGQGYRFSLPEPRNRQEAEAMVENLQVQVVDAAGDVVGQSRRYEPMPAPVVVSATTVGQPVPAPLASGADLNALDGLKVLWERASAEEKREFLRWAFD
ncbi:DUF2057 domain-containing protein [Marinobacter sp. SS21]|uniref:DUF2057 domain-containing protein n=1 Tax=Marinobacter sp. SS21 TaxID=2979460 RepID=UPI00232D31EE|nr:DUF2057 domain-containing protein [Marinobacter sp. SS21]MDC0663047.1 DUF2057 domain-containing protein [Marinobacter sp. SS21]